MPFGESPIPDWYRSFYHGVFPDSPLPGEVPYRETFFRPSAIGKTTPEMAAVMAGTTGEMGPYGEAVTTAGTMAHRIRGARLRMQDPGLMFEVPAVSALGFAGYLDVFDPRRWQVGEIKTVSPFRFADITRPAPVHVSQLNAYLAAVGARQGWIEYVNRANLSRVKRFHVEFSMARLERDLARVEKAREQAFFIPATRYKLRPELEAASMREEYDPNAVFRDIRNLQSLREEYRGLYAEEAAFRSQAPSLLASLKSRFLEPYFEGIRSPSGTWDQISGINPSVPGLSDFGTGRHAEAQIIKGSQLMGNWVGLDIEKLGLSIEAPITLVGMGEYKGLQPVTQKIYPMKLERLQVGAFGPVENAQVYNQLREIFRRRKVIQIEELAVTPALKQALESYVTDQGPLPPEIRAVMDSHLPDVLGKKQLKEWLHLQAGDPRIYGARETLEKFFEMSKGKDIWIQNVGFEAQHFGIHATQEMYEKFAQNTEGLPEGLQRLFPTNDAIAKAREMVFRARTPDQRITAGVTLFDTVVAQLKTKAPDVTRIFDALDVTRGVLALAQMRAKELGLPKTGDIFTGTAADVWELAKTGIAAEHLPLEDVRAMGARTSYLLDLGQKLKAGMVISASEKEVLHKVFAVQEAMARTNFERTIATHVKTMMEGGEIRMLSGRPPTPFPSPQISAIKEQAPRTISPPDIETVSREKGGWARYRELVRGYEEYDPALKKKVQRAGYLDRVSMKREAAEEVLDRLLKAADDGNMQSLEDSIARRVPVDELKRLMKSVRPKLSAAEHVMKFAKEKPLLAAAAAALVVATAGVTLYAATPSDRNDSAAVALNNIQGGGLRPAQPFPGPKAYQEMQAPMPLSDIPTPIHAVRDVFMPVMPDPVPAHSNPHYRPNESVKGLTPTAGLVQDLHRRSQRHDRQSQNTRHFANSAFDRPRDVVPHRNRSRSDPGVGIHN